MDLIQTDSDRVPRVMGVVLGVECTMRSADGGNKFVKVSAPQRNSLRQFALRGE